MPFSKADTLIESGSSFNPLDKIDGVAPATGLYESMNPQDVEKAAGDVYTLSQELDISTSTIEDNYYELMNIPDPTDLDTFVPEEPTTVPAKPPQIGAQTEEEAKIAGKAAKEFELKRYTPGQRAQVTLKAMAAMPLRTFVKLGKGMLLGTPDIAWAGIKKVLPDAIFDEVKTKTLDEAMDWAMNYNPSGFSKFVGEVAEFSGGIKAVSGVFPKVPKSANVLDKALQAGNQLALAKAAREGSKIAAEKIDPKTDYNYEGAIGVVADFGIGAGFSLLGSASKPLIKIALNTKTGKAITKATHATVVEISKTFPRITDKLRRNPNKVFRKMAEDFSKSKGKDISNLTPEENALMNHFAREFERFYVQADKNFNAPDIVKRRARLLTEAKAAEKAAVSAKPSVPTKVTPEPVKPVEPPTEAVPLAIRTPAFDKTLDLIDRGQKFPDIETAKFTPEQKEFLTKRAIEQPLITLAPPPQGAALKGGRQAGGTTIIPDLTTEITETSKRLGSTLAGVSKGTKEIFDRNVLRYSDRLRKLGVRGGAVAKDFDEITQRTQKRVNNSILDAKVALKGVSKENREIIAKVMNKRITKAPKWIKERAAKLSAILDEMLEEARTVGIQRRVQGAKIEIRGSGKAFPQVPNAEGEKLLKEAGKFGSNSPFVLSTAQEAVELGLADTTDSYIADLQRFREQQLRGVSSYLERTRVELPERFIEWDPDRVLDSLIQRTWLTIEGTRQWGTDSGGLSFPKLALQIEAIRNNHGPDEAKLLEQYVKAAFGQELLSTEASRKISGAIRGYQFLTKIAVSPLTITRNMLDRFAKVASFGSTSVLLRTIGQYPPVINAFLKHSREIEEEMIRRGAVFSNTAIGEGYQPGHLATKIAGKAFASSERGNQVFIALAKKNAINHNLRILRTNPKVAAIFDKRIGKLLSPLEAIGRSPTQAQKRLRELGDAEMLAKLESVDDISPDLLDAILHKTVRDTAFPVVLSTKRSWWDNKPFTRMVTQFKVWGTDQVGHVWNDVVKETVKNRDPALIVRWLTTMAVVGEIYNIIRDFILGTDESLLSTLSNKERRNLKDISTTILKDMLDGGAVGILFDIVYGLPNLIGGPTLQTAKTLGESAVKSIWNPTQAADAIGQMARKETPALRQAQGILDKVDAQFEKKNITQDYYAVRNQGFEWSFKKEFPTAPDKAKRLAVQSILGWVKNVPQERSLSYELAIRQIIIGDIDDASEHLFFLFKTADSDEELLSIEKGITSALNNASPLGKVSDQDLSDFFRGMSSEQRRTATSTQLKYDRNSAEAYSQAVRKFQKWRRANR